jgi:hypothetical protein
MSKALPDSFFCVVLAGIWRGQRGEWVEAGDEKRDTMPEGKEVRKRKMGRWRLKGENRRSARVRGKGRGGKR